MEKYSLNNQNSLQKKIEVTKRIEQKGMTFDYDLVILFSSLLKKMEEENEKKLVKFMIKGHAFLLEH